MARAIVLLLFQVGVLLFIAFGITMYVLTEIERMYGG